MLYIIFVVSLWLFSAKTWECKYFTVNLEFKVVWLVKQRKKDVKVVIERQDTSCLVLSVATNKKEYSLTIMEIVLLAIK
jgi:hypothetical protein